MQSIVRTFFKVTLLSLARLIYRQRVFHAERVPESGGVLLVANHTTYIDSFLIYGACPRPVRFVIVSRFMKVRMIGWFLKLFGAIPIQHGRAREAIRKSAEALANGEVVCIFPEGQLTRTGTLLELKKGYQIIAKKGGARVVPMFVDGLWDSIFSHEGGRHFWKWPRRIPCPVRIAFGEPAAAEDARPEWLRSRLLALSAETFAARRELDWRLDEAAVRMLKQRPGASCFIEHGKRRRRLNRGQVLAIATVLADRWRASLPEEESRIGILLPPGWTPALINLALVFAGRIPVNLPFEPDRFDSEDLAGQLETLGIRSVVTSKAFAPQLADFPWQDDTAGQFIDVGAELSAVNPVRVLMERLLARIEPGWLALGRLGFRSKPDDGEGGGSGATACGYLGKAIAEPVLLSHRAVIANALQLTAGVFIHRHERIFCEASLTTAAGTAFALWLPVLRGTICSGRSFAFRKAPSMIEPVIDEDGATLLVGSDSLIDQLKGSREPWHPEVRERVRAIYRFPEDQSGSSGFDHGFDPAASKAGAPIYPGWALDSRGVVVALSFPDLTPARGGNQVRQPGWREQSAGRLLPGLAPETDGSGFLRLTGPCFDSNEAGETGRKVRVDPEGFVFPEPIDPVRP